MKTDIQERMDQRITEIRTQNTIFDNVIKAIETETTESMTPESSTRYILQTDEWEIIAMLDESLFDGIVTIGINRTLIGGSPRVATMTINSSGVIQENYSNIDTPQHRTYIMNLMAAVYDSVRTSNESSGEE